MSIFVGSAPALVTPFRKDETVDYEAFDRLIDWQIAEGSDALVICGTTGESSTLTEIEHAQVIHHAVTKVAGRVPVIAGTGSNATFTAVDLSKKAEADGADAVLLVTPYYNKATQAGLKDYYRQVARAINIPLIMYNVPSRTGCNILPETAVALAKEEDNIVAIKEASSNISQIGTLASMAQGILDIYSGNDDQILPLLSLGGIGVITVVGNIAPKNTHDLVAKFMAGDLAGARQLQLDMMDLVNTLFCEVNPIPVKKAVALMGLAGPTLRSPLTDISPANLAKLEKAMRAYGLLSS